MVRNQSCGGVVRFELSWRHGDQRDRAGSREQHEGSRALTAAVGADRSRTKLAFPIALLQVFCICAHGNGVGSKSGVVFSQYLLAFEGVDSVLDSQCLQVMLLVCAPQG